MYPRQSQDLVKKIAKDKNSLAEVLKGMARLFPKLENDLTLRSKLDKLPQLPWNAEPHQVAQLYVDMEDLLVKMSETAMSDQEKFFLRTKNPRLSPQDFCRTQERHIFQNENRNF